MELMIRPYIRPAIGLGVQSGEICRLCTMQYALCISYVGITKCARRSAKPIRAIAPELKVR
jgi:hypothetical protein